MIDLEACPACRHAAPVPLAPRGERVETTLDLVADEHQAIGLSSAEIESLANVEFRICPRCALIFFSRRSTPEAAKRYYAQLFHRIEAPLPFDALPLPPRFVRRKGGVARDLIQRLADHGVLDGIESVLYVRCNAGNGPRILRDEYGLREVYALEVLPSCIRHAREVYGLTRVERLLVPEFENPFPRTRFDLIVCDEAFGHAHDPVVVARRLTDHLNPEGTIVAFNEKDHSQILHSTKLFPYGMNFFHKQLFTGRSLRAFLELQGFSVESLSHPTVGRPASPKNSKLLYLLRPGGDVKPELPSDEVEALTLAFRKWLSAHKWRRRGRRVLSAFRGRGAPPGIGGVARR